MSKVASYTLKIALVINSTIMLVLAAFIVAANLYVISQAKKMQKFTRSVSKFLLANQATGDLLIGLVYVPAVVIDCFYNIGILPYITCLLFFNGLFARCIIAFDRYISIAMPLRHKIIMHMGRAKFILQILLGFTISLDVVPLIWQRASAETRRKADVYFQMVLCILTTISLLSLLIVYILTFHKTKTFFKAKISCINERHMWIVHSVTSAEKLYLSKQRRLTVHFAVLAASFITTYLPVLYINYAGMIWNRREYKPKLLIDVSSYLFILNALFSPIFSAYQQRRQVISKKYEHPRLLNSPQQALQ